MPGKVEEARKILVIDDEEAIRDSCRQVLERQGMGVETAPNGESGLRMLNSVRPDIVLLDLKMPGIQGMDVLRELQKVNPDGVVIVITGYPTLEAGIEAMKCGAYDFLPKPFTPQDLRVVVKRAAERCSLRKKMVALEADRERIRNNFTAMVSHQLKTPLAAVSECIEVLAGGIAGPLTEGQKKLVKRISLRTRHLLNLVENFLRLSRFEASGKLDVLSEVDLHKVAVGAWTVVVEEYRDKKLDFVLKLPEHDHGSCLIKGDECLMQELFINLFSNCMKYVPENGAVKLEFPPREGGCIMVSVSDTGPGIPEEEHPFIFSEFFRGTNTRADGKVPGVGLGLSIVKRIVEAHGGKISLESGRGKGTTFMMKFPVV